MTLVAVLKPEYAHLSHKGIMPVACNRYGWVDLKNYIEEYFNMPYERIVERVEVSSLEFI